MRIVLIVLLFVVAVEVPAGDEVVGLPLTGAEAVAFLRTAKVVGEPEEFDPVAITGPLRVTLSDCQRTLRAIFKDASTVYPEWRFGDGREVKRVKDSYKHEIAAYELDVLLGLGIVPPCVEREIDGRTGSLCLWVENAMTEAERSRDGHQPTDVERWTDGMFRVRLFHQLIWDLDYSNIRNVIVDDNFQVYKIDSSIAFHTEAKLRNEEKLIKFSREVLAALEALERSEVEERLGPWLYKKQIKALWARRDRILKLVRERVAEDGEAAVLY
jgi:hypothetical protein